jgi:flagellar hook-associated protein 2
MGTTPATPATFNGTSTFAADLQNSITRAVSIASLPLNQLNANVTDLQNQGSELTTLQNDFAALQTAIQGLDQATNGGNLTASGSDNTVALVNFSSSAAVAGGTYLLNVIDPGSPTTTVSQSSLPTVANPSSSSISSASSFTLSVGGTNYTISPTSNTLSGLVQAINSSGAAVSATLVNIGSPSAPDYRLSVQSTALGNVAIQLNDGTNDLLTTASTGAPAQYQVNGQPSTPISSDSSTVTLAPGLTVDLLAKGQTTISVAPSTTAASNAISAFVTAYNAVSTELNNNHGNGGGALTGQSIVFSLQQSLRDLTGYSGGTGAVQNLTDLGLSFNQTGQLSFDSSQFADAANTNPNAVSTFLGSATGSGFLNAATNVLNGLTDPTSGLFESAQSTISQQINTDNQQITATQDNITTLQNQMVAQMSAADTLIATLQSQVSYFTTLFSDTQNAITNG